MLTCCVPIVRLVRTYVLELLFCDGFEIDTITHVKYWVKPKVEETTPEDKLCTATTHSHVVQRGIVLSRGRSCSRHASADDTVLLDQEYTLHQWRIYCAAGNSRVFPVGWLLKKSTWMYNCYIIMYCELRKDLINTFEFWFIRRIKY